MTHFRQERLKKKKLENERLGKLTTDGVTENRIWSGYFNK